jgi:hypothetical protein
MKDYMDFKFFKYKFVKDCSEEYTFYLKQSIQGISE